MRLHFDFGIIFYNSMVNLLTNQSSFSIVILSSKISLDLLKLMSLLRMAIISNNMVDHIKKIFDVSNTISQLIMKSIKE